MYNIQFDVKYNDIETELLEKLKNKHENKHEDQDQDQDEYEYTSQDVIDICEKLYKDELLSVFNVDDIEDNRILLTIKDIFKIMQTNDDFHKSLNEIKSHLIHDTSSNTCKDVSLNTDEFIFFTMFSHQMFHITHKCICQMLSSGTIDDTLVSQFKQCGIKMFNTNL